MATGPNAVEILPKIWAALVGRTNVTDRQTDDRQTDRQTDDRQTTDGRAIAYSEREHEFTFANNSNKVELLLNKHEFATICKSSKSAAVVTAKCWNKLAVLQYTQGHAHKCNNMDNYYNSHATRRHYLYTSSWENTYAKNALKNIYIKFVYALIQKITRSLARNDVISDKNKPRSIVARDVTIV